MNRANTKNSGSVVNSNGRETINVEYKTPVGQAKMEKRFFIRNMVIKGNETLGDLNFT